MTGSEPGRVIAPDKPVGVTSGVRRPGGPDQASGPARRDRPAQVLNAVRARYGGPSRAPGRPGEPARPADIRSRTLLSRHPALTRQTTADRSYATVRGAIAGLFVLFFICCLVAGWMQLEVVAGLGYVIGCVLAPLLVRERVLMQVVVAPPAMFLIAVLLSQALTAQGIGQHGRVLSVLEGTLLTLAALAPWLLAGTAICVVAGWRRGLPQAVRELQAELREGQPDGPQRRTTSPQFRN